MRRQREIIRIWYNFNNGIAFRKKFRKQYDQYVAAGGEAGLSITLENVKAFLESVNSEQYPEQVQTAQKYIAAAEKEKEYSANIAAEE